MADATFAFQLAADRPCARPKRQHLPEQTGSILSFCIAVIQC
jgi:hypothetical protein